MARELGGCDDARSDDKETSKPVCHRTDLRRIGSGDDQRRDDGVSIRGEDLVHSWCPDEEEQRGEGGGPLPCRSIPEGPSRGFIRQRPFPSEGQGGDGGWPPLHLNEKQARKNAADRQTIIDSLQEKLKTNPKSLMGNKGYRKYLKLDKSPAGRKVDEPDYGDKPARRTALPSMDMAARRGRAG